MSTLTVEHIIGALGGVIEPELGKDIVALDLAEVLSLEEAEGQWNARLRIKSSSPAMHARQRMREAVEFALEKLGSKRRGSPSQRRSRWCRSDRTSAV